MKSLFKQGYRVRHDSIILEIINRSIPITIGPHPCTKIEVGAPWLAPGSRGNLAVITKQQEEVAPRRCQLQ